MQGACDAAVRGVAFDISRRLALNSLSAAADKPCVSGNGHSLLDLREIRLMGTRFKVLLVALTIAAAAGGCAADPNQVAMEVGAPPGVEDGISTVEWRAMQTRRFETQDDLKILNAATGTLQDLGFTIVESSADAGVLVGSKQRDAEEAGEIAGQMVLAVLAGLFGSYHNPTWDEEQSIYMTLIASPIKNSRMTELRVLFDRRLTNNHGQLWRTELIEDPKIYQEFFDKLSEGLFLEAHKV